jgi:dipeptidase
MVTYAADSHSLYGELYHQPAADHPKGAMRKVVEWDTGKCLGEIPEVAHTYNVVGNMNEHQLVIAESTWGGREELMDTTGNNMIDYGSLIYIALQRATTAREAIDVMTSLVDKYGYASEGESFSIADKNEVWVMEMIGKGAEKGAVWIAVRIPDGAISGHANQPRIRQVNLKDKENVRYSKDLISFARKRGYYSGKDADFSFADVYEVFDHGTLRGCDGRVWSYFRRFSADAEKYYAWCNGESAEPMPLYIFPDRKVSLKEMQERMRDHFEDTPFEMTSDIGAGPNHCPYRWRPMGFEVDGKKYMNERAIATQQTGWSFVSQSRDWLPDAVGGVLWFGTDDTNTSVYMPMYCSLTAIPHELAHGNGDMNTFSMESNFWMNNWVANQAYHRYDLMIPDIRRVQGALEEQFQSSRAEVEAAYVALAAEGNTQALTEKVNADCAAIAKQSTDAYRDLAQFLLVRFMDGNMKKVDENHNFIYSADGMPVYPDFPGYNQEYYENIVRTTGDHFLDKGSDIAPRRR